MLQADCHVHSMFSSDSETPVEHQIEAAIAQGRQYFYLTDHHDVDYPVGPDERDFILDMDSYLAKLAQLQQQYAGVIQIRTGVELGLMTMSQPAIARFAAAHQLDFVIGSSHLVNGQDPYYPEYYQGKTEKQAYEQYFQSIWDNINAFSCFDVYGHLDYVIRYGPNKDRFYDPMDYYDLFREILFKLIYDGKGIEINTGSLYKGFSYPHPHKKLLQLYRQLGGEIITIGSDAHKPEHVGYGFEAAEALLQACGFRYYSLFANRKAEMIKL